MPLQKNLLKKKDEDEQEQQGTSGSSTDYWKNKALSGGSTGSSGVKNSSDTSNSGADYWKNKALGIPGGATTTPTTKKRTLTKNTVDQFTAEHPEYRLNDALKKSGYEGIEALISGLQKGTSGYDDVKRSISGTRGYITANRALFGDAADQMLADVDYYDQYADYINAMAEADAYMKPMQDVMSSKLYGKLPDNIKSAIDSDFGRRLYEKGNADDVAAHIEGMKASGIHGLDAVRSAAHFARTGDAEYDAMAPEERHANDKSAETFSDSISAPKAAANELLKYSGVTLAQRAADRQKTVRQLSPFEKTAASVNAFEAQRDAEFTEVAKSNAAEYGYRFYWDSDDNVKRLIDNGSADAIEAIVKETAADESWGFREGYAGGLNEWKDVNPYSFRQEGGSLYIDLVAEKETDEQKARERMDYANVGEGAYYYENAWHRMTDEQRATYWYLMDNASLDAVDNYMKQMTFGYQSADGEVFQGYKAIADEEFKNFMNATPGRRALSHVVEAALVVPQAIESIGLLLGSDDDRIFTEMKQRMNYDRGTYLEENGLFSTDLTSLGGPNLRTGLLAGQIELPFVGIPISLRNLDGLVQSSFESIFYGQMFKGLMPNDVSFLSQTSFGRWVNNSNPFIKFLLGDTVNATAASRFTTGVISLGAAGNAYDEAKRKGATETEAKLFSVASVAAEYLSELGAMNHLLGMGLDESGAKFLLNQARSEGREEVGSDVLTTVADYLILGDRADIVQDYHDYYKEENGDVVKAIERTALKWGAQASIDYAGGFLSGGLSASIIGGGAWGNAQTGTYSVADFMSDGKAVRNGRAFMAGGTVQNLVQAANDLGIDVGNLVNEYKDSDACRNLADAINDLDTQIRDAEKTGDTAQAKELRGKQQTLESLLKVELEKINGNTLTSRAVGNVYTEVTNKFAEQMADMTTADANSFIAEMANKYGDDVGQAALEAWKNAASKQMSGKTNVTQLDEAYRKSTGGERADVIKAATDGTTIPSRQIKANAADFIADQIYQNNLLEMAYQSKKAAKEIAAKNGETVTTKEIKQNRQEAAAKAREFWQSRTSTDFAATVADENGVERTAKITGMNERGQIVLDNGTTVDAAKAQVSTKTEAAMRVATEEIGGKNGAALFNQYLQAAADNRNVDGYRYMEGLYEAYLQGQMLGKDGLEKGFNKRSNTAVSRAAYEYAYNLGVDQADTETREQVKELNRKIKEAGKGATGRVGSVTWESNIDMSTKNAKRARTLGKILAQACGVDVRLVKGTGAVEGSYANGVLTIDIDQLQRRPGETVQGAILRVASHELTHFIQDRNASDYQALRSFVFGHILDAHTQEEIDLQRQKIEDKYEKEGVKLSPEQALDEMTARACEEMLLNGNVLAQLFKENASLGQKVVARVTNFLNKLQANAGDGKLSVEAKWMHDAVSELRENWNAALSKAAKNNFLLRGAVEQVGDLMAYHNLTEQQVLDAAERGGKLIAPSVAVTNQGMTDFGEISLMFDRAAIDPEVDNRNKLFGADAWTPSQHTLKPNAQFNQQQAENDFDGFRKGTDGVFNVTYEEFSHRMQQNDGDIYNAFAHDLGFQTAYLTERGLISNVPTNKDGSIDTEALESTVDEKLDNDREWRNYKRWLNEFSDRAVEQHGIATDEDVLRNMQQQPETGKRFKLSFDGKLTVPAAQYTSVDEFHRNSDRLSSEAAAAAQTVADAMMEFARTVAEENGVRARDSVTAINRAFGQRYNAENITEVFRDAGIKLSAEQAQKIQGLYQQAVELPTEYFEAKLMRNVGLQEAGVAVIPSDTSAEVRQILEKQGVRLAEYKAGDTADRIAVLNQQKDMMLTAQKNTATDGGEVQYSYAGSKALYADMSLLETAKEMEQENASSEDIRKQTGWFKGYDGKWRFEIDDSLSKWKDAPAFEIHEDDGMIYRTAKLGDLFKHDKLFRAYPQLADITVVVQPMLFGLYGSYSRSSNSIALSDIAFEVKTERYSKFLNGGRAQRIKEIEGTPEYQEYHKFFEDDAYGDLDPTEWLAREQEAQDKFFSSELGKEYYDLQWGDAAKYIGTKYQFGFTDEGKSVLLHELQHAVQEIEGFTKGSNTNDKNYDRSAGEIEARDVQSRKDMTAEQRKNTRPDIDRTDVVFTEKNNTKTSATSPLSGSPAQQGSLTMALDVESVSAAAKNLGIDVNVTELSDSVKHSVFVFSEIVTAIKNNTTVFNSKKTISAKNIEGILVSNGVLSKSKNDISAYRTDGDHTLRISDHSSNANNFTTSRENLSIVLLTTNRTNYFVANETKNVIEAEFKKTYLDSHSEVFANLVKDIARFVVTGKYTDTAGAKSIKVSGSEEFINDVKERMDNGNTQYSIADDEVDIGEAEQLTDEDLLWQIRMEDAKDEGERDWLDQAKGRAEKLKDLRAQLKAAQKQIRAWEQKGKRSGTYSQQLIDSKNRDIRNLEKQVARYEKMLDGDLRNPKLQRLLKDARANAASEMAAHKDQVMQDYRERKKHTELVHKIGAVRDALQKRFTNPGESTYIPIGLANSIVDVINMIDVAPAEMRKVHGEMIPSKSAAKYRGATEAMQAVYEQYEALKDNEDFTWASEYDKETSDAIKDLVSRLNGAVTVNENGQYDIKNLSNADLQAVYDTLRGVTEALRNATKLLAQDSRISVYEAMETLVDETMNGRRAQKNMKKPKGNRAGELTNLNIMRAALLMSNMNEDAQLYKMWAAIEAGDELATRYVMEYNKRLEKLKSGKNEMEYLNALHKQADFGIKDVDGRTVKMTKMQLLQAMMTWEREAHNDKMKHIEKGFMEFRDAKALARGDVEHATNKAQIVKFDAETFARMQEHLTDWDRQYMAAVREYLSGTEVDAVNSVMYQMKHRTINGEEFYFPVFTDHAYLSTELEGKQDATQMFVKSPGSTKALVTNASTPIIIDGLDTVMSRHVQEIANYVGLALPIRDFAKVYNARQTSEEGVARMSAKKAIERAWGRTANAIIENNIRDVQKISRAGRDNSTTTKLAGKLQSVMVRSALVGRVSVVIKQAASYQAAGSVISDRALLKHEGEIIPIFLAPGSKAAQKIFAEIDAHTSLHYNRRLGMSMQEIAEEKQKVTRVRKVASYIGAWFEQSGVGHAVRNVAETINIETAIQRMDVATTAALWNACKSDVKQDFRKAKQETGTDEYWAEVTRRYEKAIRETQPMYDALHRTEESKSKSLLTATLGLFKTVPYQNKGQIKVAMAALAEANATGTKQQKQAAFGHAAKTVWANTHSAVVFSLLTLISQALRHKMKKYRDDDDELTAESVTLAVLKDTANVWASNISPIWGGLVTELADRFVLGNTSSFDVFSAGAIDVLNDTVTQATKLYKVIGGLIEGDNTASELISEVEKTLLDAVNYAGIPAENVRDMISGIAYNIRDINAGLFPAFNNANEKSDSVNASRYSKAILSGDKAKAEVVYLEMLEKEYNNNIAIGMSEETASVAATKKADGAVKSYVRDQFVSGKFDAGKSTDILSSIGLSEDDIYWALDEWKETEAHKHEKEILEWAYSKYHVLHDAIDTGKLNMEDTYGYYEEHGIKRDSVKSEINKYVKDLYLNGDIDRKTAESYLTKWTAKDANDAYWKVDAWEENAEHVDDDDYSYAKYGDLHAALDSGSGSNVRDAIKELTSHGVKESTVTSDIRSYVRESYSGGTMKKSTAVSTLTKYGDMTEAEAQNRVQYWEFQKKYPDADISEEKVAAYYDNNLTVPMKAYITYCTKAKDVHGVDADGDGKTDSGSKKAAMMQMINELPISNAQKDELYYLNGWAASKIYEAPWH